MRFFARPPWWTLLLSFGPPALVLLLFLVIAVLPLDGKQMAYVGVAYMIFFPVLVLFLAGLLGSIASVMVTGHEHRGMAWPLIGLMLNLWPFWSMASQFIR